MCDRRLTLTEQITFPAVMGIQRRQWSNLTVPTAAAAGHKPFPAAWPLSILEGKDVMESVSDTLQAL